MFSAEVTSPSGEQIPRIFPRILEQQRFDFVFESTILDVQYELSEVVSGDERLLMSFRDPTPGIWEASDLFLRRSGEQLSPSGFR